MRRATLIGLLLLTAAGSLRGESSLSALGYGWQFDISSARSAGMGLAGIAAADSLSLDLFSPANWSGAGTARFGFNGWIGRSIVHDPLGGDISDNGGLGGAGFAIHVGKGTFVGVTVAPNTLTDYRWRDQVNSSLSPTITRRQGRGGLSQALIAASAPVGEHVRLGLAARPLFGKVERFWAIDYTNGSDFGASETISERFSGLSLSLSGRWWKDAWGAGFLLNTPARLNVERQVVVGGGGADQVVTTYDLAEGYDIPLDAGVGVSRSLGRHLLTAEAMLHGWGAVDRVSSLAGSLTDGYRLSAGWEWAPEFRLLDPAWKGLVYRAGIYATSSYALSSSEHQPRRGGLTGGLGVPYAEGKSRLDLALEVGWVGDSARDGARERSLALTIGFNHSELWFVGRRARH